MIANSLMANTSRLKTLIYTLLALLAFAGNSVLCRLALGEDEIDAASFTVVRLLAGIAVLLVIRVAVSKPGQQLAKGSWLAAAMLFIYALGFSYAYVSLDTGTGALILFGTVQMSILLLGYFTGHPLAVREWLGVAMAFLGFIYLLIPTLATPSLLGFVLMVAAGMAWAVYTLQGRGSADPITATSDNFLRTLPMVLVLLVLTYSQAHLTQWGLWLAILSGGVTSGIGYTLWYYALKGLSLTQAAVVQLLVPIVAAAGGVIFSAEVISLRLVIASLLVLGGIAVVVSRSKQSDQ